MFPSLIELANNLDAVVIPAERDAIVSAIRVRDRLDAKIAAAVGEFQAHGLHELDGSVTMASWLRHRAKFDPTAAVVAARRAAKLHRLPVLRAAFGEGLLSGGAVDVILAQVVTRHLDRFAEQEPELVPLLAGLDIDALARAMQEWRARADALDPGPAPAEKPDTIHLSPTLEGRGVLNGSLGSDLCSLLAAALRVADGGDFDLPLAQRRAQALGQVCQTFLDHNPTAGSRRHRPHVTVTMTYEQWADHEFATTARYGDTGLPVSPTSLGVLRCDAAWHRLTHTDGAVLQYGRAARDWPIEVAAAIAIRDGGCRWPGCTAPPHWCDIHHAQPWEAGGTTDIHNGLALCRRHHHRLHSNAGWHLKLLPDATVEVTHPDGTVETTRPRGLAPPRLPLPSV